MILLQPTGVTAFAFVVEHESAEAIRNVVVRQELEEVSVKLERHGVLLLNLS